MYVYSLQFQNHTHNLVQTGPRGGGCDQGTVKWGVSSKAYRLANKAQ